MGRYVYTEIGLNLRLKLYKSIGGLLALFVVILSMVSPLILYPIITGVAWDSDVPDWLGWLVVIGGGIGAGLAILTYRFIICTVGGYPEHVAMQQIVQRYK